MSWVQEYVQLLHDPAHIAFEATFEIIVGILISPIIAKVWKRAIRKHDREEHGHG